MKKSFISTIIGILALTMLNGCQRAKTASHTNKCIPASELPGIVGGNLVSNKESLAKKVVMLLIKKEGGFGICTGTPIGIDLILTAGHCVQGADVAKVSVVFHTDLTCESGFDREKQAVKIKDFAVHSNFQGVADAKDDLALIKLNSPIPADYQVSEIYDGQSKLSSDEVTLAGYGITDESRSDSMFLRKTKKSFHSDLSVKGKNIVMSQPLNGVCSGDSGGPVFVEVQGKLVIAGVNSIVGGRSEDSICHESAAAMYTPAYQDWIQSTSTEFN